MLQRRYPPGSPLAAMVDQLWLYDGETPEHAVERILPSGTMQLLIQLHGEPFRVQRHPRGDEAISVRSPLICGPHAVSSYTETAQQRAILGVSFQPGGVLPALGVPAEAFRDSHVPLEAVWGARAGELRDRVLATQTH